MSVLHPALQGKSSGPVLLAVCRNELSLSANISKIAWKYGDSGVAGTVSDRQRKDLRPFHFDPAAMSDFEMANKLWEVIA